MQTTQAQFAHRRNLVAPAIARRNAVPIRYEFDGRTYKTMAGLFARAARLHPTAAGFGFDGVSQFYVEHKGGGRLRYYTRHFPGRIVIAGTW